MAVADSFTGAGDFDVVLDNHGAALHVHLRLEGDIVQAADLSAANRYVEDGAASRVQVSTRPDRLPAEGRLEIVTGYGARTEYVALTVEEPTESEGVAVDERLGEPPERRREPLIEREQLPVLALGALAVLVAGLAAIAIDDPVILGGVILGLAGIVVAAGLLNR